MNPKPDRRLGIGIAVATVCTFVSAVGAGYGGMLWMQIPFYLGFWFMFVLAGLIGMFVLASIVASDIESRRTRPPR